MSEPENEQAVSFTFSADELLAIGVLAGESFSGAGDEIFEGASEEARAAALSSARRSLVARGVVAIERREARVLPPFDELFVVVLSPGLVVRCERRVPGGGERRIYYGRPDVGVEHAIADGYIHRLTVFPPHELLEKVVEFFELAPAPSPEREELFVVPLAQLKALENELADGATASSISERFPPEARTFLESLDSFVSSSQVVCLHRTDTTLSGGELRWLDVGEGVLWLFEPAASEQGTLEGDLLVEVRRVGPLTIVSNLLDYLPGGSAGRAV